MKRSASGLVRTLVVASATLAILLVCFSMYQYSQLSSAPAAARQPRLPSLPTKLPTADVHGAADNASGVTVGGAKIGTSQNVTISLYPREGQQARLELTVTDWVPKEGSDHEFALRDPEIRMQTNDGNDVRVTAKEGDLEARRKGGSGLEPLRGQLRGGVVVEFDRRTQAEKSKLPEALRAKPEPGDLVRAEADALEFDVEFGKLTIPGRLTVSARDVSLDAVDLEVRFDEQRGRVESLRIDRGGHLELLDAGNRLRVSMPGADRREEKPQTISEWLRATVQARLDAGQAEAKAAASPSDSGATRKEDKVADGVPVFRAVEPERPARSPVRYHGRFEGDVDARQQVGDVTQSRLQADALEILREFSPNEKPAAAAKTGAAGSAAAEPVPVAATERIVLTWTGRLTVEALAADDARVAEGVRARVTAIGAPARVSHPEGDATCAKLSYDPDGGEVRLWGTAGDPVVVRSVDQGAVRGESVVVRREGESFDLVIAGPGQLVGDLSAEGLGVGGQGITAKTNGVRRNAETPAEPASLPRREIDFATELHAVGRIVHKTAIDFTGSITSRDYRVLDRVTFTGRTKLLDGDTGIEADALSVGFQSRESWREVRQGVDRLVGEGAVVMTQGRDRLTCDKIDVTMKAEAEGGTTPRTAVAVGNVAAVQGDRILEARDRLIVDFERVARAKTDDRHEESAGQGAAAAGAGPTTGPGDAMSSPGGEVSQPDTKVVPRRLRAFGSVTIIDPSQPLDLACEQLDCTIGLGRDIETALVSGTEERPATVRLETLSVTGREISLNVPEQSADVPGRGRMTFQSKKDLDGRKVAEPIPIVVTWTEWMKYRGRENRAVFAGGVHATSEATTSFDCETLLVEFEDAPPKSIAAEEKKRNWGVTGLVARLLPGGADESSRGPLKGFSKEPRYIEATGNAVAETAELDAKTSRLKSRARISGPKLSVHLRSELSKLLIEGPGNLQLEDFRSAEAPTGSMENRATDLFTTELEGGPSKTLIQWRDRMWYDFSIDQTLFEGAVQLTHLSGRELDRVFGVPEKSVPSNVTGRRTFLSSDTLAVDFLDRESTARRADDQRMGRLSSDRLRQFRAQGNVVLRDEVERLSLSADEIVYERARKILSIQGTRQRKAQIIKQSPGKLPDQVAAERLYYNLATGQIEVLRASIKGE